MHLLRTIGSSGRLYSYERRADFAAIAQRNVEGFFGAPHPAWEVRVGDLVEAIGPEEVDRAILEMLAPWECIDAVANVLAAGGIPCCYVATATQLGRTMDTLRAHGGFTEPAGSELSVRQWHAEGLAIRPGHATTGHTGFLIFTRRLALRGLRAVAPAASGTWGVRTRLHRILGMEIRPRVTRSPKLGSWPRPVVAVELAERRLANARADARSLAQANEKLNATLREARGSLVGLREQLEALSNRRRRTVWWWVSPVKAWPMCRSADGCCGSRWCPRCRVRDCNLVRPCC